MKSHPETITFFCFVNHYKLSLSIYIELDYCENVCISSSNAYDSNYIYRESKDIYIFEIYRDKQMVQWSGSWIEH
jgi:hypothetical protein